MRVCSKCGIEKPHDAFNKHAQCRDGHRPECRICQSAQEKARPKAHRASKHPDYKRQERMRRLFGMTLHDYERMYAEQDEVCAICKRPDIWARRDRQPLVIDHDHATGVVRGLLCNPCNALLGWARDQPEVLDAAATYLRRVEVRQEEDADVQEVLDAVNGDDSPPGV